MNAQKADVVIVYKIRMLIKHYCEGIRESAKIGVKDIYFILFYSAESELTFWWEGDKRIGIGQRELSAKKAQINTDYTDF